jgi:PEP-CTERM motif-containing protein
MHATASFGGCATQTQIKVFQMQLETRRLRICFAFLTAATLWLPCAVTSVRAGTVSYAMTLSEDLSVLTHPGNATVAQMAALTTQHTLMLERTMPYIELKNTSTDATSTMTQFSLTIGDTSKNFDWAMLVKASPGVTFSLQSPDAKVGFIKSDVLSFNLGGFGPGDSVILRTGLSPDDPHGNPIVDYRATFFQLNSSDMTNNAQTTGIFQTATGQLTVTQPVPDFSDSTVFSSTSINFPCHFASDTVTPFTMQASAATPPPDGNPPPSVPEPGSSVLLGLGMLGLTVWKLRRARG